MGEVPRGRIPLPFAPEGNFIGHNGPFFGTVGEDGVLRLGFRAEPRHCNSAGSCHGGMMATFADLQFTFGSRYALKLKSFLPTISLSTDFLAEARSGDWVEGETQVLKVTRNLIFSQCLVRAEGRIVLRGNAILKNARPDDPPHAIDLQVLFPVPGAA